MSNLDIERTTAIVRAIDDCLGIVVKSTKPRVTNAMIHKYLDDAVAQLKEKYAVKTRDELVEMMTNEIEDEFSNAMDEARRSAEREGEVDDSMVDEAFANALSNATTWSS